MNRIAAFLFKRAHSSNADGLFPKFSQLPSDLQKIIWALSLPGPRVITITTITPEEEEGWIVLDKAGRGSDNSLKADVPRQPGQLFACRASRDIALSRYKLMLSEPLGSPIFFDTKQDWLHFDQIKSIKNMIQKTQDISSLRDIKRIAVNPLLSSHLKDLPQHGFYDRICSLAYPHLGNALIACGGLHHIVLLYRESVLEMMAVTKLASGVRDCYDYVPRAPGDRIPSLYLQAYCPKNTRTFDERCHNPKFDEEVSNQDPETSAKNTLQRVVASADRYKMFLDRS